ncbi:hypothetical protein [Sneathiella sp.]|uniref:hypothetical protein n=1 Tax=Sneathiella sp. TaxID=1964365 RepID=UPI0035642D8B
MRQLRDAEDFFEQVAKPAYKQFSEGNPDFLNVFSMVNSMFNMAEWLFHHNRAQVQAKFGKNINSGGRLWKVVVETEVVGAGLIRDVANSSKHVILAQQPSTDVRSAEDTGITTPVFAPGIFDSGIFQTSSRVLVQDGKRQIPLEPIAEEVFLLWGSLIGQFYPT